MGSASDTPERQLKVKTKIGWCHDRHGLQIYENGHILQILLQSPPCLKLRNIPH
jgi:hypothetical protein